MMELEIIYNSNYQRTVRDVLRIEELTSNKNISGISIQYIKNGVETATFIPTDKIDVIILEV